MATLNSIDNNITASLIIIALFMVGIFLGTIYIVVGQVNDTETLQTAIAKDLKKDIAELKNALEAHDTKPEWWQKD